MRIVLPRRTGRARGFPGLVASLLVCTWVAGCRGEPSSTVVSAPIGDPLPGLTAGEVARFEIGRSLFGRQFTPETGLGPRFNENSCDACHTGPEVGGTGETIITRASRFDDDGRCDLLPAEGGENLRLRVTPQAEALGAQRPKVPVSATHHARFTIPFLFGLGLVDAIPQSTLDDLADPADSDGDGISGRVGRDAAGRPARFGRKADLATLADFVDDAFRKEIGVTTPAHPSESTAGSAPRVPDGVDLAADPEVGGDEFRATVDFVRMLAPPPALEPPDPADRSFVARGRALCASLRCASCHVPTLQAGPSDIAAVSGGTVALYSDLLLHDMGPNLAGTCAAGAGTTEWRTEPLMGLRYRRLLLHDGRAGRVMDAILAHGGEAQLARDSFAALDRLTQEALLRFLGTL
jgi:CxxC motif-containing protein (DUF1111 family)